MNHIDMQWLIVTHAFLELQKRFRVYLNANPFEGVAYLTVNDIKRDDDNSFIPAIWQKKDKQK